MESLKFSLKLREVSVQIVDIKEVEHKCTLRELNGLQRNEYNESIKIDLTLVDGKPQISTKEDFKMPSEIDLLEKCLYDENEKLIGRDVLVAYPTTVITSLHEIALKLSGLDKLAPKKAKNDSEVKD